MSRSAPLAISPAIVRALSRMQSGLNGFIDPQWLRNRSLDDWGLAITLEAAELIDSYPWKWWKNVHAQPDFKNVRIELVDILHFSLSGTRQMDDEVLRLGASAAPHSNIRGGSSSSAPSPATAVGHQDAPRGPSARPADQAAAASAAPGAERHTGGANSAAAGYPRLPLSSTQNAVDTFRHVIDLSRVHRFDRITEIVIASADDLQFNLVAYYVAKHTLNYIRQLGGYKGGQYKKVNAGVEDNELLHQCIHGITVETATEDATYRATWETVAQQVYECFQVAPSERRGVDSWLN